ncbi:MAG TPA: hypothetical protein DEF51_44385 [Myxococcales bacterium]|nr:hypothetical protein [Myxococcales bacterium]
MPEASTTKTSSLPASVPRPPTPCTPISSGTLGVGRIALVRSTAPSTATSAAMEARRGSSVSLMRSRRVYAAFASRSAPIAR